MATGKQIHERIAVARKGILEGLNAPAFERGKIQKWCWYRFVQTIRYWTELIDEIKFSQCNLQKFARAKFRNILLP